MLVDKNVKNTKKFIWQALYIDALRGWDATGLATVSSTKNIEINKKALPAQDFLSLKQVDSQIEAYAARVFIGHNRAATRGAINNVNSHPFQHGHITLVHNGSLVNYDNLPDHSHFQVDSDALAHSIYKIGTVETLKKVKGAFALVWYDSELEKVFMVRNSQRPLHFAFIKNENMVMYASEKKMLEFLISRAGYEVDQITELPVGKLISFDPFSDNIKDYESQDVDFFVYNYSGGTKAHSGYGFQRSNVTEAKEEGKEENETTRSFRESNIEGMFKDVGIVKGESLQCCMYEFRPFEKGDGKMGVWEGATCHEPFVTVMAYGTRKTEFDTGEVYAMNSLSMQVSILPNFPKAIKENRVIVDHTSSKLVSDDEFLDEMERKDNESALLTKQKVEKDKKDSANQGLLLLEDGSIAPSLEDEVAAYKSGIDLIGSGGKAKGKFDLQKELLSVKKDTLYLPNKVIVEPTEGEIEDIVEKKVDFIYVMGPRAPIPLDEYTKLTDCGCSMCSGNIGVDDADHLDWWGDTGDRPICPTCVQEWMDMRH